MRGRRRTLKMNECDSPRRTARFNKHRRIAFNKRLPVDPVTRGAQLALLSIEDAWNIPRPVGEFHVGLSWSLADRFGHEVPVAVQRHGDGRSPLAACRYYLNRFSLRESLHILV